MHNCSLDRLNSLEDGVIRCSKSKSLLSDISKYLNLNSPNGSKQNVELGLEIEINESVQKVLKDDSSSDELLAVTIIRPSDSELVHETTVALNKEDVKEFIALVERHRTKHQLADKKREKDTKKTKTRERIKEKEYVREKDKESERKIRSKERSANKVNSSKDTLASRSESKDRRKKYRSSKHSHESKEILPNPYKYSKVHLSTFGDNHKQVYTTINTFDKLKEVLPCQNKYRNDDKPGAPCICQNCGIMDVLIQSQKGPVVEFPPLDEVRSSDRDRKEKHKRERRESKCNHPNVPNTLDIDILKEINVRINSLEKRLAIQEETAVSRDYLKHVLHKIFAQYKHD